MRVENSYSQIYAKESAKQMAVNAASSAVLSTGLTLAVNRGQNPKNSVKVGAIVAGISLIIDAAKLLVNKAKNKNATKEDAPIQTEQAEVGKLFTHQG